MRIQRRGEGYGVSLETHVFEAIGLVELLYGLECLFNRGFGIRSVEEIGVDLEM